MERIKHAAQNVVSAVIFTGVFNDRQVLVLGDDANHSVVASGIGADRTRIFFRKILANATGGDLISYRSNGRGEFCHLFLRLF